MNKKLYKYAEVAGILGLSGASLRRLVETDQLSKPTYLGKRSPRFRAADLEDFLRQRTGKERRLSGTQKVYFTYNEAARNLDISLTTVRRQFHDKGRVDYLCENAPRIYIDDIDHYIRRCKQTS